MLSYGDDLGFNEEKLQRYKILFWQEFFLFTTVMSGRKSKQLLKKNAVLVKIWITLGPLLDHAWTTLGPRLDHAWTMLGPCMDQ